MRLCTPWFILLAWLIVASTAAGATVDSGHVRAELLAAEQAWLPGGTYRIGLQLEMTEGWHTYWRNPGDSGAPTTLDWQLPAGVSVSDVSWPVPEWIPYGPLINLGYHDRVLLLMDVTLPGDWSADEVRLTAAGEWLVCADICIPEQGELELIVPVGKPVVDPDLASLFQAAAQQLPRDIGARATTVSNDGALHLEVRLSGLEADRIEAVRFLPYVPDMIELGKPQTLAFTANGFTLNLVPGYDFKPGMGLDGVIVVSEAGDLTSAFEVRSGSAAAGGAPEISGAADLGALLAVLFAFLGGLILNLMPCVFPVLSIKILSLLDSTHGAQRRMAYHGYAYTVGVILSFVGIAVLLIALRASGAQIGWGFQLQSPWVVALLFYLFVVIGLSLSGFVEFGGGLMNTGAGLADRSGVGGSFFTGVLAAVVAAPCTAPFMGAAIGFAMTQPAAVALAVFAALGAGMAAPYLALCLAPGLLQRLPRPGAWMETLKELFAFPMYASALWLLWVLVQQTGADGVLVAGGGLLLVVFALWNWRHGKMLARAVAVLALASGIGVTWLLDTKASGPAGSVAPAATKAATNGPRAEPYSPSALASALAAGPVFVNFTAAWCITCKVNDVAVIDTADTAALFSDHDVTYLKGDWTNEDPGITAALAAYGRNGVPLYLVYERGSDRAVVLPQILTGDIVREAVVKAVGNQGG